MESEAGSIPEADILSPLIVVMTPAGATFPYGKDPQDSNIRIAPSFPTLEELKAATEVFALSVKLVSIDKILEEK